MTELTDWATWREIASQPGLWPRLGEGGRIAAARAWLEGQAPDEVWLCGAGSSSYVGEIVAQALEGLPGPRLRALATTDIVARPRAFLPPRARAVVVQFGRSGDSAESVGLMDAMDALAPDVPRLHVTCNPGGALATRPAPGPAHALVLAEAHDAGFAMTASVTSMLLATLALLAPEGEGPLPALGARLAGLMGRFEAVARAERAPERAVFLGSGPLAGAARESALKVMELAKGAVPCLWETPLGFRHGPKSFVQGRVTTLQFLAPRGTATRAYDDDLGDELRRQFPAMRLLTVGEGAEVDVAMPEGAGWGAAVALPLAQMLAVAWSHGMGLRVDLPFEGEGTLSRVVTGVRLHAP